MEMDRLLEGKVAVVTGGTRGIGYAIVKKYLEAGATVILFGSTEKSATGALERIRKEMPGSDVHAAWPQITDTASVKAEFENIEKEFGKVDILANNAGISHTSTLYDYRESDFEHILDLNVKAVYICSQAAATIMKKNGGGVIVNTSSMVSIYGQPSGCGYPASKFAVNGLTKSLARELGKDGIRVNAVAPGVIKTEMLNGIPEDILKPIIARTPLGRMGEPEDIANAFLYLSSDMASYVTGAVLSVDGGTIL